MHQQKLVELCGFGDAARKLAGIYGSESLLEPELDKWFADADFEALPPEVTCMAAAAGASVGFAGVPQTLIPRLRGIIKYVHTLNSGMMAGVCALGAALNRAGIPVLLLDDTALYMRYPNAPQRHLWQMSVGVRQEDYARTLDIAREAGFRVETLQYAAVARQGVTQQIVIMPAADTSSFLWSGAVELKKGNVVFLCPEAAAMLIAVSRNAFRALTKPKPRGAIVRWIMDMKILMGQLSETQWRRAAQLAADEHVRSHIHLLLAVYAAVTGVRPEHMELFGEEQDAVRLCQLLNTFRALSDKGSRIRRVYLQCRLRRPDSLWSAWNIFAGEVLRKLRGKLTVGN